MVHHRMQVTMVMVVVTILVVLPCSTIGTSSSSTTAACNFPATSMISTTSCSTSDSETSLSGLISCLPYLDEDEAVPDARCCAGVKNVSALHTPCLCKVTFYPPQGVNVTRQKLMPGLCNVTSDLCTVCAAFLVTRVDETVAAPASGTYCCTLYTFLSLPTRVSLCVFLLLLKINKSL